MIDIGKQEILLGMKSYCRLKVQHNPRKGNHYILYNPYNEEDSFKVKASDVNELIEEELIEVHIIEPFMKTYRLTEKGSEAVKE